MFRVLKGGFGSPSVIDHVILETSSLLFQRRIPNAVRSLNDFVTENKFRILFVTEDIFSEAMKLTLQNTSDFLTLADSSQIVFGRDLGVDTIATFDSTLGNFFEKRIGKGCFESLDKKEKRMLTM